MGRFVRWPSGFLGRWEGKASELRKRLQLRDDEPLDPFKLIETTPNMIAVSAESLESTNPGQVRALRRARDKWWAAAYREADGPWMIFYSPWQAQTRLRASVMEEVAHIHLRHKPSEIFVDLATGLPCRSFSRSKEQEAYGVAAAALVPFVGLVWFRDDGWSDVQIAAHFGVSVKLVQYRANVTRAKCA